MAGINKIILIGNIGRDPEIRYSQGSNTAVAVSMTTDKLNLMEHLMVVNVDDGLGPSVNTHTRK